MDPKERLHKKNEIRRQGPKVVGLPRNEFGTRLCQRVECTKCKKVDYIPVRLSAAHAKFCRDCAEKFLDTWDQGRQIALKKVNVVCEQCFCHFEAAEDLTKKKKPLLCLDCLRGFEVWRGKAGTNNMAKNATRPILTKIGSRTTFRKSTDDKI